jgi:aspartate-semialdehyde dehydrogenase
MPATRKPEDGRKAHVAVFDATTLVAKGIKDQLVGRKFPIASMRLYTSSDDPDANLTEFGGEAMLVSQPDIEALGSLDIAFFCGTRSEGERYLDWPGRKGFVGIDLTAAAIERARVPLVNSSVNPEALPAGPGLVGTPHPIALMLSTVFTAIERGGGLQEAAAVVFQPVSELGEPGIAELYQQTLGLLNFHDQPRELFDRQVAFNLVPDAAFGAGGVPGSGSTEGVEREIRRITGERFPVSAAIVLAPVFHGHAAMTRVVLPKGRTIDDLKAALSAAEGIRLAEAGGAVTPVERAGEAGILATGIRPAGAAGAFWIWLVSDNLTSGAALNAVRIAEAVWSRSGARKESA